MSEVYKCIVDARLEFDPSWNHSCQEQALRSASEYMKLGLVDPKCHAHFCNNLVKFLH